MKVLSNFIATISIFSVVLILGCGEDAKPIKPTPDANAEIKAINEVLKNWREGYQNEDIETYMASFWEDDFRYLSDLGTDNDLSDDVEFTDTRQERESAIKVFDRYQKIEIEFSPPEIEMFALGEENKDDPNGATVKHHYSIQGFIVDGELIDGGYTGWYAEGDNIFTFKRRNGQWRISEWIDEAFSEDEIAFAMEKSKS